MQAPWSGRDGALAQFLHFLSGVGLEVLREADVVVKLPGGAAAYGSAVYGQAERVAETLLRVENAQQKGVAENLHGLHADTARNRRRERRLFKTQISGIGGVKGHQNRIPLVVRLQHGEMGTGIVVAGKTEKAALAGLPG